MSEHLILVDASGFAFRAFYCAHPRYREDGTGATGAIEVFMSMVWRMLGAAQHDAPTMGVAVFDAPGGNFRHKLFPAYKSNRPPARRQELDQQFPIMRGAADLLGLTPIERAGYEADDIIATLAARAVKAGIRVTIVSSDKDFAQCVSDGEVEIVDPMLKKRVLEADVVKKFGVPPYLVPDVQALAGDSADGIPGMPGCGLDIGARLVRTFDSLDKVLKGAKDVRFPKVRVALGRMWDVHIVAERPPRLVPPVRGSNTAMLGQDWCRLFLKLTTLKRNVPMRVNFEDFRLKPIMREDLLTFLNNLGAGARAEAIFGMNPQLVRPVEGLTKRADPLAWWKETVKFGPGKEILPEVPQCGFYQRKIERGGAFVPAKIWREPEYDLIMDTPTGRDLLRCQLGKWLKDPLAEWPRLSMSPISEADYAKAMLKWRPDKPAPHTGPRSTNAGVAGANPHAKRKSHV